jgi:superfamily II DNA or RNA helicase
MTNKDLASVMSSGHFYQGGNSPLKYFQDCLNVSTQYRRAAGYFSSSMFIAADTAMSSFIDNGGSIRIVCSPRLMPEDIEAISDGIQSRLVVSKSIEREIFNALEDVSQSSAVKILGLLVTRGQLEFRIAVKKDGTHGMFHSKVGIFEDASGTRSAFCGSTNETWSGWADYGNSESFVAMNTAGGEESLKYVNDLDSYFTQLWNGNIENLEVRPLPDTPMEILAKESRGHNLEELVEDLKKVRARQISRINDSQTSDSSSKKLMPHQIQVLKSWKEANCLGIIDHVTGAGKTISAIAAIREWVSAGKPALVIVPSTLLQKQWASEIRREIGIEPLFSGGSLGKRSDWLLSLSDATRSDITFGPRITVSVLGTSVTDDFIKRIQAGTHLLVVGDEVHTLGQLQAADLISKIETCGARLGLSATYERYGDIEGTKRIENGFGYPLKPSFTIRDAIDSGRLVPYIYHIERCNLDHDESERFEELTKQIQQMMARESKSDFMNFSPYLKMLIFKRAKIIKQANSKISLARSVLKENFKQGDRWLVYCDDINQIDEVETAISDLGLMILKYFDAMTGEKKETLDFFSEKGGVLLAIKCLDEGVDIPSATHALILASSQNPREYIQRRGRVLRSSPLTGKYQAEIFDVVTLDENGIPVMETELNRMWSFAQDADNSMVMVEIEEMKSQIEMVKHQIFDISFEESVATSDESEYI